MASLTSWTRPIVNNSAQADNKRLKYALDYVAIGWAVVPLNWLDQGVCSCGNHNCPTPGKHPYAPLARHGVHSASKDVAVVTDWFTKEPRLNIGIACGEISGIVVLDVDPRNGGDDSLLDIEKRYGKAPDTPTAITGGGGQHFVYKYINANFKSPGKGLDVLANGKLFVVAPSSHKSGNAYEWEAVADPLDGCIIAAAPFWLTAPVRSAVNGKKGNLSFLYGGAVGHLDARRITDLRSAMAMLDPTPYDLWLQVGQALHSTSAPEAFEVWDTWSQTASNYENGKTEEKWQTFSDDGGLHVESIFAWAKDAGWQQPKPESINVPVASVVPSNEIPIDAKPAKKSKVEIKYDDALPSHLLTLPGPLGDLVTEINRTADKRQPQFAVQTALALASVVLGRRYVALPRHNFTSQYFMAVGESGCGKEYGKKVIETILRDAKLEHLLGPSGYTSDSGVFSSLAEKPCHISLMDELGMTLRDVAQNKMSYQRTAFTILVGLWGRLDGAYIPQGRSLLSAPKGAPEALKRPIECPAISILGMSTPGKFYESLTDEAIEGGFLSRFLIVQTNLPLMRPRLDTPKFQTPNSLLEWLSAVRDPLPTEGNLAGVDISYSRPVERHIDMTDESKQLLDKYYDEILEIQQQLQKEGYAELENRSAEKALRLSICIALSESVMLPKIEARHMQWAIDYVRYYTAQMVRSVRDNMVTTPFAKRRKIVLRMLGELDKHGGIAAEHGLTMRDMSRQSVFLREMTPREWADVLNSLGDQEKIEKVETARTRGPHKVGFRLRHDGESE